MFLKPFLALAALLALVQFSVALHAEKPGVSIKRSTPPLAKRSPGNPITTAVKHTKLSKPAVRRNLVAEARDIKRRDEGQCEEEDYGYCDKSGECCPMDTSCCDDGNCAKDGETCCDEGGVCGEDERCCDDGCIDEKEHCCGDYSCAEDEQCCSNGGCAPEDGECCASGGYCDSGTVCVKMSDDDEEEKAVCCEDTECSEYDGDISDLPTPKNSGNRNGDAGRLWNLAGSIAVPVAAAAWL